MFYDAERPETTFQMDFKIAEIFGGAPAIKDTYKRAKAEFGSDYKMLTELVMCLNHTCWLHYERGNSSISELYGKLYYQAHNYALKTLKGDKLRYYIDITD